MKLLQIANGDFFSTFGGGQVYVKNLVDEMIDQGLDVTVFSFVDKVNPQRGAEQKYRGISIFEFCIVDKDIVKKTIAQLSPDIVHAHAQKSFISLICRELSIPCIVTAHHGGITCPAGALLNYKDEICNVPASHEHCLPCVLKNIKGGSFFYPILRYISVSTRLKIGPFLQKLPFIYGITPVGMSTLHIQQKQEEWKVITDNATLIIAPSIAIADNMILNGLNKDKTKLLSHGIPFPEQLHKEPVDIQNRKVKFFYTGRISYIKGIHILLNAFSQLNPEKCELYLIGDMDGKFQYQLKSQFKRFQNIVFYGKIKPNEILNYINSLDILVHSTICLEVFGLNIAEALLAGKPVIATQCGGAEMQIQDRENGLLVPPNDAEALRNAMLWMMEHREEVKKMSEKAPLNVISISEHVKQVLTIYKKLNKS